MAEESLVWLGPLTGQWTTKTLKALLKRLLKDDFAKVTDVDFGEEDDFLEAERTKGLEVPWKKDRTKHTGVKLLEARLTVAGGRAVAKGIARALKECESRPGCKIRAKALDEAATERARN